MINYDIWVLIMMIIISLDGNDIIHNGNDW